MFSQLSDVQYYFGKRINGLKLSNTRRSWFLMAFLIAILSPFEWLHGQNLALNKPYTLSADPNYYATAPWNDRTALTDGMYTDSTKGRMWFYNTTVGWRGMSRIRITIDLGSRQPIGSTIFSTAAGTAEVYFPQNVFIFLSNDNKQFEYAGDLMSAKEKTDTSYGIYRKANFRIEGINRKMRYVLIEIIPRNKYLFCDEIQVFRTGKAIKNEKRTLYNIDRLNLVTDSLKIEEHAKENLLQVFNSLPNSVKKSSGINPLKIANGSLKSLLTQIGEKYGSYLRDSLKTSWSVGKLNPWNSVSAYYRPISLRDTLEYQLSLPVNGVQYGSFTITNASALHQKFSVNLGNAANAANNIKLFEVPFVNASEGKFVADPLIPVNGIIDIAPGLTKLLFFKISGNKNGNFVDTIRITGKDRQEKIIVRCNVFNLPQLTNSDELSAIVWAYFTFPMLKERKFEAVKDLHEHHINTIDIPVVALPALNVTEFASVTDYLKNTGKFERILLFYNFANSSRRNGYRGGQFLSPEWKNYFKKWYASILKSLAALGYSANEIYFYPYDEVTGKENIQDFIRFIQWAKANVRDIQFFATLSNEEAIQAITPLVDIAQIHFSNSTSGKLPKHNSQVWTYDAYGFARTLPAYSYYRLMAWKAFAGGYKGIGFWNYAAGDSNTIDQFFLNPAIDFSAIYTGPDSTIYSSRRWEAFRLGIEDYWILKSYSKKFGYQKAKSMVEDVLSHPADHSLADSVRNEMMSQL